MSSMPLVWKIANIPPHTNSKIFRAFTYFHPLDTKVIIVGHLPNTDNLAYSGMIGKNLAITKNNPISLSHWAAQGVLLLNLVLEETNPGDWINFTTAIIAYLLENTRCECFIWNKTAASLLAPIIEKYNNRIICAPCPSSDFTGFARTKIDWSPVPNIKIFTDGGCDENGKKTAVASFAAIYENFHIKSIGGRIRANEYMLQNGYVVHNPNISCPPTNNRGELLAIIHAINFVYHNFRHANITIVADNMYSINTATQWMEGWIRNGTNKKNMDLVKILYHISQPFKIEYVHQYSHRPNPTTPNELGNKAADDLASTMKENLNYKIIVNRKWEYD